MTESPRSGFPDRDPRLLVVGPVLSFDDIGGLQLALRDLAGQLEMRGWRVELHIEPAGHAVADAIRPAVPFGRFRSALSRLARSRPLFGLWHRVPVRLRRAVATPFKPRAFFANAAGALAALESLLADLGGDDTVLFVVDQSPPGAAAMVASRHPRVIMLGLGGLAEELCATGWAAARLLCRLRFGRELHPFLYRKLRPESVRQAVLASRHWREQAIRAGLPPARARVVYFGIPLPAPAARSRPAGARILWVGRLVPDKGLHLLLRELADIRGRVGAVSLTVVAGQGQPEYREMILHLIERRGLGDCVTLTAPVPRERLRELYAQHDMLFFYSRYRDPVALVLMESFAAGLPVVASVAAADAALVRDGETCLCYRPGDGGSVAAAVTRMLTDPALAGGLAGAAQGLVRGEFSLDAMGEAYDRLLRAGGTAGGG